MNSIPALSFFLLAWHSMFLSNFVSYYHVDPCERENPTMSPKVISNYTKLFGIII